MVRDLDLTLNRLEPDLVQECRPDIFLSCWRVDPGKVQDIVAPIPAHVAFNISRGVDPNQLLSGGTHVVNLEVQGRGGIPGKVRT